MEVKVRSGLAWEEPNVPGPNHSLQQPAAAAKLRCSALIQTLGRIAVQSITFAAAVGSYLAGATATLAAVRGLEMGDPMLALVVGGVLGTQIGALIHYRQPAATNSVRVKAALGLALALAAIGFILTAQWLTAAFESVELSLPIGAIGSFVLPFVLSDTMKDALSKGKKD